MIRASRAFWWGIVASLLVGIVAFGSGMAVALRWGTILPLANILGPASAAQRATPDDLRSRFNVYWETWNLVERSFYRKAPLNHQDMVYASIEGMLQSLGDENTRFERPVDAEKTRQSMAGQWEGIGAILDLKDGKILIVTPLESSPAERAGLQGGDVIVKVDDAPLAPLLASPDPAALQKVVSLIRGPKGTTVKLVVQRPAADMPLEFVITRDTLPEISVRAKVLDGGIAYIQLTDFNGTTTGQLDKALNKILPQNPRGIILDVRGNPGGLLATAQEVLGRFLDGGIALIEQYGTGVEEKKQAVRGPGDPKAFDIPMVVLINGGSASASEIVAGALRDRGRAIVLGEKSFGKGSVQAVNQLSDASSARITIAHYLTPNRDDIHSIGITPQHVVPYATDEQYRVNFPPGLPTDPSSANDSQLWWAIQLLITNQTPPPPPNPTPTPHQ